MDPFKELTDLRDAYQKKIKEYGVDKFKELFTEYFKQHPMVEQVYWDQYAPYFNDGDACVFRVNEGLILVTKKFALDNPTIIKGYDEEAEEEEEAGAMKHVGRYPEGPRWFDTYMYAPKGEEKDLQMGLTLAREALSKLLEVEDVLESVFGDSVGILVTRTEDGVEIETGDVYHD